MLILLASLSNCDFVVGVEALLLFSYAKSLGLGADAVLLGACAWPLRGDDCDFMVPFLFDNSSEGRSELRTELILRLEGEAAVDGS